MSPRAVSTALRIGVLMVLVLAVLATGKHRAPSFDAPSPTTTTSVIETPEQVVALTPSTVAGVTSTTAPTQAPQPTATLVPTVAPTVASGPGTFTVPANSSDASIIIERGPTDRKMVALTFDAGEGRGSTEQILDLLKERGLHASFGTTAAWARENLDLILRIINEGHLLFNHSDSHLSWTGVSTSADPLTNDERTEQVMGAHDAVEEIAGWNMQPFWRPPYGDWDPEGQVLLKSLGYDYTLFWTCDSLGWNGYTAAEIAERCGPDTELGGPGAIILFHVSQEQDYLSLPALIDAYQAEGYDIVTMDKMISG